VTRVERAKKVVPARKTVSCLRLREVVRAVVGAEVEGEGEGVEGEGSGVDAGGGEVMFGRGLCWKAAM